MGSGKTIVAIQAAILAIENGYQVALMAPTEILATQHYLYIKQLFRPLDYRVELLISARKAAEKAEIKQDIAAGAVNLAIGTHALIEEDVRFARLGLVVVDEQHRFGVLQRFELMRKGYHPDVLVMTATPIPRTLALTLYGDLDFSVIDELPPHRTPIVTKLMEERDRESAYTFLREKVRRGEQAYVVCPVIEEGGKLDLKPAVRMYEQLARNVFPEFRVGLLHGRLASDEKEDMMQRFKRGEVQILVATTVVEVGVDVPNATIMLIEHADRFGLSQLHQLRGRIGRGSKKSYCLLMAEERAQRNFAGAPEHHGGHHRRFSHCGDRPQAARSGRVLRHTPVGNSGVSNRQSFARPGNSGMGQARGGGICCEPSARRKSWRRSSRICAPSGRAAMDWRAWRNRLIR